MGFTSILLVIIVAFAFSVVYRRFQMRAARIARVDGLAAALLSEDIAQANRQRLADVLKDWDSLSSARQTELLGVLSQHPRLEGVDLRDDTARLRAYEGLVGISPGKSPEK